MVQCADLSKSADSKDKKQFSNTTFVQEREMALVDYLDTSSSENSVSDDDVDPSTNTPKDLTSTVIRHLLPTATSLLGKRIATDDAGEYDDPTKHSGRIRAFKHERGNWSTHVYVPVVYELLEDLQAQCMTQLASLDNLEFHLVEEFHISLSKTVVLQYHLIESFMQSLEKSLGLNVGFSVSFPVLKIYTNEEKTRTFISLAISEIYNTKLQQLLDQVNSVMSDYKLPTFYKTPSFHVSIIWCLGDQMKILKRQLPELQKLLTTYIAEENLQPCIDQIRCKSGNKEFICKLK